MTTEDELIERAVALAADVAARVTVELVEGAGRHGGEEAVFRRLGEYWTLRYEGVETHLRDSRGLQHLARLLATPGAPVHALELMTGRPDGGSHRAACETAALDGHARAAYRQRLAELDAEIEVARSHADLVRVERAADERDYLLDELSRAVGLHGRDRALSSPVERARVAVTKAVRAAERHITAHHRALGAHLTACVRTGTWCCYTGMTTWECGSDAPPVHRSGPSVGSAST